MQNPHYLCECVNGDDDGEETFTNFMCCEPFYCLKLKQTSRFCSWSWNSDMCVSPSCDQEKKAAFVLSAGKKGSNHVDAQLARGDNAIITLCMKLSILCPRSPQPITWRRAGWEREGLPGLALKTILLIMRWKKCSKKENLWRRTDFTRLIGS